jgi:transcription antitermination factor NusA-like protein
VKTPLCDFCLKSGVLCPKCQEKIRSGKITDTDMRIAKLLVTFQDKYSSLQQITFYKAYNANGVLAILVGQGDLPHLLGYGGKILRELAQQTGKNIRILEKGGNIRKLLEDLLSPATIISLNTIWLPDGTTETRAIINGHSRKLPMKVEALKGIVQKVQGTTIRVEFERKRR